MERNTPERERLEKEWLDKLTAAKNEYRMAADNFKEVISAQKAKGLDRIDADGQQALFRATREESELLANYLRVLKIFSDLIVHGVLPPAAELGQSHRKQSG